ncbi:unnamed protein product [Lactuca saligna]|uniref:Uncharacterized protein n=1 Tax=Lactuca saligna TaxID=75948 RepID=A0AA35VFR3_LACSI|nr:unnamed protein product [Lactuca saligna]
MTIQKYNVGRWIPDFFLWGFIVFKFLTRDQKLNSHVYLHQMVTCSYGNTYFNNKGLEILRIVIITFKSKYLVVLPNLQLDKTLRDKNRECLMIFSYMDKPGALPLGPRQGLLPLGPRSQGRCPRTPVRSGASPLNDSVL